MAKANFFQNLLSSLFGSTSPEALKKKQLKNITKTLSKSKFKFYKSSSHEVDPAFAKFMYEIYKAVSPAQGMFQGLNPKAYGRMVVNYVLSDEQKNAIDELSEENIMELSKSMGLKELDAKVKGNLEVLTKNFDNLMVAKIDAMYTKLVAFAKFCTYDFYFMLKKFDGNLREKAFNSEPRFIFINGTYIAEDIRTFTDVAWSMNLDADYDDVFKMLKSIKGSEPVSLGVWRKILARLRVLRDKKILEMLVQLLTEDPSYREEYNVKDLYVADDYLSEIKKTCENALQSIKAKQTAGKVDVLLNEVFGTKDIERLKNYNDAGSSIFEKKSLGGYEYTEPLAYLKYFLLNYTKKEIRELSDIILVRGEWASQQLANPMSEGYNTLLQLSDRIIALDNRLIENVDLGLKLKTHLPNSDRSKDSRNIIQTILNDVNNEAANIILTATKLFISYARNLKMILEDCVKQHPEVIVNWKDIDHFAEGKLKQMCVDVYKKIYSFVTLLQNFEVVKKDEEE